MRLPPIPIRLKKRLKRRQVTDFFGSIPECIVGLKQHRELPIGRGWIVEQRSKPEALRCDNGLEFTSRHFLAWREVHKFQLIHIQPGRTV